jgi:hypothetical protein
MVAGRSLRRHARGSRAWLADYLLPPSRRDIERLVEQVAVGHAASAGLSDRQFDQLVGGWYAVLEGRWRRNRP